MENSWALPTDLKRDRVGGQPTYTAPSCEPLGIGPILKSGSSPGPPGLFPTPNQALSKIPLHLVNNSACCCYGNLQLGLGLDFISSPISPRSRILRVPGLGVQEVWGSLWSHERQRISDMQIFCCPHPPTRMFCKSVQGTVCAACCRRKRAEGDSARRRHLRTRICCLSPSP